MTTVIEGVESAVKSAEEAIVGAVRPSKDHRPQK